MLSNGKIPFISKAYFSWFSQACCMADEYFFNNPEIFIEIVVSPVQVLYFFQHIFLLEYIIITYYTAALKKNTELGVH